MGNLEGGANMVLKSLALDMKGLAFMGAPVVVLLYVPVIFTGFALLSGFGVSLLGGIILLSSAVFLAFVSLLFMLAALLPVAFLARVFYPDEFNKHSAKVLSHMTKGLASLRRFLRTEGKPPTGAFHLRIYQLKQYANRAVVFISENLDRWGKSIQKIDN
eukprot:760135-Hanusia_phi.AAC.3